MAVAWFALKADVGHGLQGSGFIWRSFQGEDKCGKSCPKPPLLKLLEATSFYQNHPCDSDVAQDPSGNKGMFCSWAHGFEEQRFHRMRILGPVSLVLINKSGCHRFTVACSGIPPPERSSRAPSLLVVTMRVN